MPLFTFVSGQRADTPSPCAAIVIDAHSLRVLTFGYCTSRADSQLRETPRSAVRACRSNSRQCDMWVRHTERTVRCL